MKKICRNCGKNTSLENAFGNKDLLSCPECEAYQWIGNVPNFSDLYTEKYFAGDEYVEYEKSVNIYRRNLARKWENVVRSSSLITESHENLIRKHVFEIGSATGEFLKILKNQNFTNCLGAEISSYCRIQAEKNGIRILNPLVENYLETVRRFQPDVLCAWDVWEHLENPADIFREMLIKNPTIKLVALTTVDSGALIPRYKKQRWRQFHPPTHLNYPTRKSFEIFFQNTGFSIKSSKSFGYFRPLADYLSVFFDRKKLSTFDILFKIPIYLDLYDIQMVIAERNHI
jgi:hypothetical protein